MFELEFTKVYAREYKKLIKKNPQLRQVIQEILVKLATDPEDPSLKSHLIKHSELGRVWSSWVLPDLRILWEYQDEKPVILVLKVGNHDQVYS